MLFDVNVQRVRNGKNDTRKTCRYQRGNENMLFDEGQTIQWPAKKDSNLENTTQKYKDIEEQKPN